MPRPKKSTSTKTSSATKTKPEEKEKSGSNILMLDYEAVRLKLIETFKKESVFNGDLVLPSGQITTKYLDLKESTLNQTTNILASMAVLHHLKDEVEYIGGFRSGAYVLATGAMQLAYLKGKQCHSFFLREQPRQFGYSKWIEGPLKQGSKVCIVQDLVVDGIEVIDTIRKIQEESRATIVQVIGLVDRQDGAQERLAEMGLDYTAICKFDEIVVEENNNNNKKHNKRK